MFDKVQGLCARAENDVWLQIPVTQPILLAKLMNIVQTGKAKRGNVSEACQLFRRQGFAEVIPQKDSMRLKRTL